MLCPTLDVMECRAVKMKKSGKRRDDGESRTNNTMIMQNMYLDRIARRLLCLLACLLAWFRRNLLMGKG